MAQLLANLPVGAKIKDPTTLYNGKPILFKVAGKNHAGYPTNSVTLITDRIISVKAFDGKEASNSDTNRRNYGNNRYAQSNIRQWLNSAAGSWYSAQHSADAPPNTANVSNNPYDTEQGFLANFSNHFRNAILNTTLTVAKNTVSDGGGSETVTDKVFLLSNTEVGLANENNIVEGAKLDLFSDDASRLAYPTTEAVTKSDYSNSSFKDTSPWYYWLRTPYASHSYSARIVHASGALHGSSAYHGSYGVRPALNLQSNISVSDTQDADGAYTILWNANPSITLDETDNRTLYENDTLNLSGQSVDTDAGDVVSIKYSVNNGTVRTLNAGVSNGSTPIGYGKTLKLSNGKLLDGTTVVTDQLAEGTAHTLRVWAEDDKGGKSQVLTRTFYTVLNRAPIAQIVGFTTKTELSEADSVSFNVNVEDLDGNNVVVKYILNGAAAVEVYNGAPGNFTFTLPVTSLKDGDNTLVLQAVDVYNFQSSKTYKLDRNFVGSELTQGVARYKMSPSSGTAIGMIAWIEHQTSGNIAAELSIVDSAAAEAFEAMEKTNTVELDGGVTETEFSHISDASREKITLKLKIDKPVVKISGAFQQ